MRFLKTKILKAREAVDKELASGTSTQDEPPLKGEDIPIKTEPSNEILPGPQNAPGAEIAKKLSQTRQKQTYGQKRQSHKRAPQGTSRATKNIVINFGKAISSFAGSHLATPYLKTMLEKENLPQKEFVEFVNQAKSGIGGIDSFRLLLLIEEKDNEKLASCKRIFAEIGEVFIKCFSVNWITHGRINDKLTHLKYRSRVLRRIKNPELFTYISGGKRR